MNQEYKIEALKNIVLFFTLTSDELRQVQEKITVKTYKKNAIILHEEDTNEYMYIIVEGEVKVIQTNREGKELLLTRHRTGDFFGELSLIDGKTEPAAVVATMDSVTALIAKKDFYTILYKQNKVMKNLLKIMCSRLRELQKKVQMMNFNNAAQRMKMLFLMLAESFGESTGEGTVLNIRLIHQDIADMTGLTRETVTRIIDKMKKNGEIKILKNRHILLRHEFDSITL
jgi:CRP/FNR family transcriptional regulator, cyclic AMP receptor protein